MENNSKRFLSLLLALVMVLGMFPMTHAHAEGEAAPAVYQVTEVVDGGEYAFVYGNMRAAYNRVNGNNRLDAGDINLNTIKDNAGYRWKLEAVDSDGNSEIEGYRIKGVSDPKYLVLHEGTAALVENAADAQVFTFEYTDAGFMIHDKNVSDSYFNNFAGGGNIAGWTGGTGITVYRYEAEHIHNYVDAPAVEPTLNSAGLTAGTVCVCGAVGTGREPIPAKDYNEGIVPLDKIIPTAGNYNTPTHANDGGASYALDNNLSTMWHSNYSGNSGYGDNSDVTTRWIDFAIDGAYDVTGLRYLGRDNNGNITKYTIQVSYDGTSYEDLTTGTWADNADWKEVKFETTLENVKNVRLLAVESRNGYVVAVEMRLVGTKHEFDEHVHTEETIPAVAPTFENDGKTEGKKCSVCGDILVEQEIDPAGYKVGTISKDAITATAGSIEANNATEGSADYALDGNFGTMWHTDYDGTEEENLWIDYELTGNFDVTGLRFKSRPSNANGYIAAYEIWVSYDGVNYIKLEGATAEDKGSDWKNITFANGVQVQNVRLLATETSNQTAGDTRKFAAVIEMRLVGEATEHAHLFCSESIAPTCTTAGYTTYTCVCGATYTVAGAAATGHSYTGEVTTPATCTTAGVMTYTCSCDDSYTEEIPATGHTNEDGDFACDNCGEVLCAHANTEILEAVAATCTEAGLTAGEKCTDCGAILIQQEEIPALGHTEETVSGKAATCTETGLTDGTKCSVCGEILVAQEEIPALGHNVETVKFTVSAWKASSVDPREAETYNKNPESAFDGDPDTFWASQEDGSDDEWLIADLGSVKLVSQAEITRRVYNGSYKTTGAILAYVIEVSTDGETWTQAATGTIAEDWTVAGATATFEAVPARYVRLKATSTFAWGDSNLAISVAEFELYGPAQTVENEVAADCTTAGSYEIVVKCSVCEEALKRETVTVEALGHDYDAVVTAPTCTTAGYTTYTCACGDSYVADEVAALGHTEETIPGKAATCTETGLTDGVKCSVCGVILVEQEEIPMVAHTYDNDQDPDCNVCGATREVEPALFEIAFSSMTMENSLDMNFAFAQDNADDWTGYYAMIQKIGENGSVVQQEVAVDTNKVATIDGVKYHYVTFTGIAAKEMTDKLHVTIYNADGKAVSKTWIDSVRDHAIRNLELHKDDAENCTMVVDMLNYGAEAQENAGYKINDLANKLLSDEQKAFATESVEYKDEMTNSSSSIKYLANVKMVDNIQFMMAFYGVDESMTIKVSYQHWNSTEDIVMEFKVSELQKSGSYYVITLEETVMADGFQTITSEVIDADGNVVAIITDSMASYAARAKSNTNSELYDAIMKFSTSALDYLSN